MPKGIGYKGNVKKPAAKKASKGSHKGGKMSHGKMGKKGGKKK